MKVRVSCREGPGQEAIPVCLRLGERDIEVRDVLDRWPGTDCCYFKLMGEDGALYILRKDVEAQGWELIFYKNCMEDV